MGPKLHQLQNVIAHEGIVNTIALGQRTGQVFATGGDDRHLFLWSIGSNNPRSTFGPFQSAITSCIFNSTEEQILCGNNGGTVMLFDLNESRCAANWAAHRSAVHSLKFHPQDPKMAFSCGYDGKLHVLGAQQRRPLQSYNAHSGPANHVSASSDGRYVATCGDDKTIRVFDLIAGRQLLKFDCHSESVKCIDFHPSEPLLMSGSADRSIRFFDLMAQREIPVSFPLDTSPVDVVRFAPTDSAAFSASADYLKVVGWSPPEFFDHFTLGLEHVHDVSFVDRLVTVASSSGDRVRVHRMRVDSMKPFSSQPSSSKAPAQKMLDLANIPAGPKRVSPPERTEPLPRIAAVKVKRAVSSDSAAASEELKIFEDFRKPRGAFMNTMNEKYARLTRISDMLDTLGLAKMLATIAESGDLGVETLIILRMKPEAVKLEHSGSVIQIAGRVFDTDHDLAIATVESMLQAFGKMVHATRSMSSQGVGSDGAFQERKKKCELFVESFREIAPRLRTVSVGRSPTARTATEILDEWKVFLR
jgi:hypothetical protein